MMERRHGTGINFVAQHVKYYIIFGNIMEYGYHGINPGLKVQHLLNGIGYDQFSTAVTTLRTHPDTDEKDFDTVVTFLTHYIDKRRITSLPLSPRLDLPRVMSSTLTAALSKERLG